MVLHYEPMQWSKLGILHAGTDIASDTSAKHRDRWSNDYIWLYLHADLDIDRVQYMFELLLQSRWRLPDLVLYD